MAATWHFSRRLEGGDAALVRPLPPAPPDERMLCLGLHRCQGQDPRCYELLPRSNVWVETRSDERDSGLSCGCCTAVTVRIPDGGSSHAWCEDQAW